MAIGFLNMRMDTKVKKAVAKPVTEIELKISKYDVLKMSRTLEINMKEGDVEAVLRDIQAGKEEIVKGFILAKTKINKN